MGWIVAVAALGAALSGGPQLPFAARSNQCATCHLQLVQMRPGPTHTDEWVTSSHASHGVGCEKCHRGDAATSDRSAAHRGVVPASDSSSSVHRTRLTVTCGGCHAADANAFARSTHDALLQQGDSHAPTCLTCHSSMAADILSPIDLERACRGCHSADRASRARRQLEAIAALQRVLRRARLEIAAVADQRRGEVLNNERRDADIAIRAAVAALHAFDQPLVDVRLDEARVLVEILQRTLSDTR
jgi:Cytochrome c554 and c-prime